MTLIEVRNVTKSYAQGDTAMKALDGVDLDVHRGELMLLMGPSGSGKTTLLSVMGCILRPTTGAVRVLGEDITRLPEAALPAVRRDRIGFVFQQFNLLARTTAVEQVELPLLYAGAPNRRKRALEALSRVQLADRWHHRPTELSGGQQQRVAIARALVNNPAIILADEPTGALDTHTSEEVMAIFQELNREGITVIFVTHEADIAEHTRRNLRLSDGLIVTDEPVPPERQRIARRIIEAPVATA